MPRTASWRFVPGDRVVVTNITYGVTGQQTQRIPARVKGRWYTEHGRGYEVYVDGYIFNRYESDVTPYWADTEQWHD